MFKHLVHTSLFCCCFFFSLYPSLIFSATAINKILTYPEVSVKKQVSWKSSGCTEMITLFTSVALCLLNRNRELEVSYNQYWKLQIIFMMFLYYMFYNQVPWISGGICQFIKLNVFLIEFFGSSYIIFSFPG